MSASFTSEDGDEGDQVVPYLEQHEVQELRCEGILNKEHLVSIDRSLRDYHSAIHLVSLELPRNGFKADSGPILASILESQRETLLYLDLSHNPLTAAGVNELIEPLSDPPRGVSSIMPSCVLVNLNLTDTQLGAKGAASIARLIKNNRTLKELHLGGNEIKRGISKLAPALAATRSLEVVSLQNSGLGSKGASILAKALETSKVEWTLTSLDLAGNDIRLPGIAAFQNLLVMDRRIKSLHLGYNGLGEEGAKLLGLVLKFNYTLKELALQGNHIGDDGAMALAEELASNNNTLERLQLDWNKIGPRGASALAKALKQNSTLCHISLADNDIDSEGATNIADSIKYNMALKELVLSKNKIDDGGAFALTMALGRPSSRDLKVLLEDNDFTEVGMSSLERIPSLRTNLGSWFGELLRAIASGTVGSIDLSSERIGEEEIFMLAEALAECRPPNIQSLWLSGKMLTSRSISQLAQMALSGPSNTIVRVYVKSTDIGDEGAEAFGHALVGNLALSVLVLNDCAVTAEGCKALAAGLRKNSVLRRLNLDRNAIGDEGMCHLLSALPHASLKALGVAYNGLTDAVMSRSELKSLEEISLSGNDVTDRGALQLCPHLMDASSLQWLSLYRTQVTSRGRDALRSFLPENAIVDF